MNAPINSDPEHGEPHGEATALVTARLEGLSTEAIQRYVNSDKPKQTVLEAVREQLYATGKLRLLPPKKLHRAVLTQLLSSPGATAIELTELVVGPGKLVRDWTRWKAQVSQRQEKIQEIESAMTDIQDRFALGAISAVEALAEARAYVLSLSGGSQPVATPKKGKKTTAAPVVKAPRKKKEAAELLRKDEEAEKAIL